MKMLPLAAATALLLSTSVASANDHVGSGLNERSTLLIGAGGALLLIALAAGLGGSASGTN